MAAISEIVQPKSSPEPVHQYHADAFTLELNFEQPVQKEIEKQTLIDLPDDGRLQFENAGPFSLRRLVTHAGGYTQVSGHKDASGGFVTVATAVVEGLNVMDVLTADRVVAQISTMHPPYLYTQTLRDTVPSVTFLGTRFENLKIDGREIELDWCLDVLGKKPANGGSYFDDQNVIRNVATQYETINSVVGLPAWAKQRYQGNGRPAPKATSPKTTCLDCSLINGVENAPGISFGHVIDLPKFGKIFLAELVVDRDPPDPPKDKSEDPLPEKYTFHLSMVRLKLGSLGVGTGTFAALDTNGQGTGGHKP